MNKNLKPQILSLREQGKTYNEIASILNCSKGSISYHCSNFLNNEKIEKLNRQLNHIHKTQYLKWDKKTIDIIKILYNYGIQTTEIADVLKLDKKVVNAFCKLQPKKDYSHLPNYEKVKKRRKKIKILAVIYKGYKCKKCGYNKYFENLEFHHRDPSKKDFTIAAKWNSKWSTIKKELDKCDMYCAICHRELHIEQNEVIITPRMLLQCT